MDKQPNITEQMELLLRGVDAVYTSDELRRRLTEANKPLRIKLGMDPTAPDIHLGHSVVLSKMRQFQDLGHKAVLIIGDYTARIGDPSGQNSTRPTLTPEQIQTNATTYFQQAGKILDTSSGKLEIRYNSEWLGKLTMMDIIHLTAKKTVAQMLQRESFKKRLAADQDVFLHEFLYPVVQGYDSVVVEADVELGGTDQTFNCLVGRDIQRAYDQPAQIVLVMPLLAGLDGVEKMSKSKGNYVGVTDPPNEMFGKIMSIPDTLMVNYFTLLTDIPVERIKELVDGEKTHPRQAKATLGRAIVERYYDLTAATAATDEFDRVFSARQTPSEIPDVVIPPGTIAIVGLVVQAGFAKSNGEARRLISQNAVSIDGDKITDVEAVVNPQNGQILRVGKRRFGKIVIE
ncbi:MAG: tyrosine--tRNA ligase [Planctomycetota bacterium]|nr:tyrosine--tRNA ligase [Planctomycetota bacterium]